jgi:hypothetical protein
VDTDRLRAEPVHGQVIVPAQATPPTVGALRAGPTGWRARLRRTPGGALLLKTSVFLVGLTFVVLGCVLIVAPGPLTIPPILLGLWIWSTEFAWADRQLDRAKASARVAWQDAQRRPIVSAVVTGGGLVGLGVGLWLVTRHDLVARVREVVGV